MKKNEYSYELMFFFCYTVISQGFGGVNLKPCKANLNVYVFLYPNLNPQIVVESVLTFPTPIYS